MADSPINDGFQEDKKTASAIIEDKILLIIRQNYGTEPLDKGTAIKTVSNKFRLTKSDTRRILLALDKDDILHFGKRRVQIPEGGII